MTSLYQKFVKSFLVPPYFFSSWSGSINSYIFFIVLAVMKFIFNFVSASIKAWMAPHVKFNAVDGFKIYIFSKQPQKLTDIQSMINPRPFIMKFIYTLRGKPNTPFLLVSNTNIQFSTFPGTIIYFLILPIK